MYAQRLWQFLPAAGLLLLGVALMGNSIVQANDLSATQPSHFSVVNHFYLNDSDYQFTPASMPDGYSWGGSLYVSPDGKEANTELSHLDSDQFLKVVNARDPNQYCVLYADTEFGDNRVRVYSQHNIQCQVATQNVSKVGVKSIYDSHISIQAI